MADVETLVLEPDSRCAEGESGQLPIHEGVARNVFTGGTRADSDTT